MHIFRNIFLSVVTSVLCCGAAYGQDYLQETDSVSEELASQSEEEEDGESLVIEPQGEAAMTSVYIAGNIMEIVDRMEQEDEQEQHFAVYEDSPDIVEYNDNSSIPVVQKFDVIKSTDNEGYDFTFVRQTVYNEARQAWDYMYERVYNNEGRLIMFVRKYNTYDSGCAEVAFEQSDYIYDNHGQLASKTYRIFDSDNNPLDNEPCWMGREEYEQYGTYTEFISQYPLPLQ
ncbi:MAG: hypothetical protein J6M30_04440 [Bacteroidales bacterium]|nr:hypothetical protein [Bacteroidales bacterium]